MQSHTRRLPRQYPVRSRQKFPNPWAAFLLGRMAMHKAFSPILQKVGFVHLHFKGTSETTLAQKIVLTTLNIEYLCLEVSRLSFESRLFLKYGATLTHLIGRWWA